MFIILSIVVALVVIVGAVFLIGALLPVKHTATVRAIFPGQSPEAVWAALTDVTAFPSWRDDLKSVEIVEADPRHLRWKETGGFGSLVMERGEAIPPRRLEVEIVGTESGFGGRWIYELAPSGAGTTLSVTEEGEVYNPLFRFMSRFIFGHHATMKKYLAQLGKKFGETVEPSAVS